MYLGEYRTQLSEKNRVALPKNLRKELDNEVILTRGYEKCILMLDKKHWDGLLQKINQNPLLKMDVRDTKRYLIGGAFEVELDKQGRFVIPDSLRLFSGIEDKIVFLGVGEWIEVWDEASWDAKLENLTNNASEIADRLST
ncbi:MAG: division/cell wall cluster transcriptional repressor MraZ [Candidatus Dojkabacteria bacterium]|nr:MAG: division/cell wall cluster transcriptional repressor MraZ [Candidatus Dojkabacteria bacterium]GIW58756.1 MAG: division/cell wall cluster transcriptional repressor MraZ [Candidatus Dojkabacteria bacterium]